MLRLPDFTYVRPRTLAEASRVLGELGPEAMAVAGGTDVYPKMKRGQFPRRATWCRWAVSRSTGASAGSRAAGCGSAPARP